MSDNDCEFSMEAFSIDIEVLIDEIRVRSVLWNLSNEEYKDRVKRECAWKEVFAALNDSYDTMSESKKTLFGKHVQSKWKNIKDTYRKYKQFSRRKPENGKKKKKYVYEKNLRFLDCLIPDTPRSDNNASVVKHETVRSEGGIGNPSPANRPKPMSVEERVMKYLEDKSKQRHEGQTDEHQSFFNSLLSIVRMFNDDEVLEFRAAVISIAQEIRKRRSQ